MTSRWWTTAEVIVVLVLVAAWSVGYVGVADELQCSQSAQDVKSNRLTAQLDDYWPISSVDSQS